MSPMQHPSWRTAVMVSVALLVCVNLAPPSIAEPGDSPLEAHFLPRGSESKGIIGPDYLSDYYKVIVPAMGRLVIRLYDITLQDNADQVHLFLLRTTQNSVGTAYTTYANYVAESRNAGATPDVIDIPDLPRGIYFIQVRPYASGAWNGASYSVKADLTIFPPVVSDDVGDERQYALPTVNQLPTNGNLWGSSDVDCFECDLPYNTNLTLSITEIGAGGNVDVEVYTAWNILIGSCTQSGSTDELLYLPDLVPGQYFIEVKGQGTPAYTLTVTQEFAEASDILDDVGNDLAHAMPLLPGNPSVLCLQPYATDRDIFSLYQPEDGTVVVDVYNMFFWDPADDLSVRILDEYGNLVAQSDHGSPIPEHIEVALTSGQYFVEVYGQASGSFDGTIYTIKAQTSRRDVGDALNQAMQIHAIPYGSETYGYPYIGRIDGAEDVDYFQVVLKDSGFIYIETDRMMHANVDVQLFDGSYALLQTSANPGTLSDTIYVDGLDAGTYFIRVYSPDAQTCQYRLTPTIGTVTSPIGDDIGDDPSRAFPLTPYRRVSAYIWDDFTSDYFSFRVQSGTGSVRIRVGNQHVWDRADDIKLHVYDASGTEIALCDNDVLEDEFVELKELIPGTYYARVAPQAGAGIDPIQYTIVVETDVAPPASAGLSIQANVQGGPGEVVYAPVVLDNPHPDEITAVSIGVQFDPSVLEPMGVCNTGLTSEQSSTQVRYTRSMNTISASMDNFSTVRSGELMDLIFRIRGAAGTTSPLIVLVATLNGALVPATDGSVTVSP